VLAAVSLSGAALQHASAELRRDREIVLRAVSQDWRGLPFSSEECRDDGEIIRAAVSQCGESLRWASSRLCSDEEIVKLAVSNDGGALDYASEALQSSGNVLSCIDHRKVHVLRVALLSGRSCVVVMQKDHSGQRDKAKVLRRCARKLGLSFDQRALGELWLAGTASPVPAQAAISDWPGFVDNCINDLQLVLPAHAPKRRREVELEPIETET